MTLAADSSPAVAPSPAPASASGSPWPPGFRFHPTDEELVLYYLKRKICKRRLRLNIISELDVYKWDPEELPGQSLLKTGDRQWFFFSQRDRRYPNAARSNRATRQGYWKATGKDRIIISSGHAVGVKKTLVFYKGRAPSGERTNWVMHEYTMDEEELKRCQNAQDYYALYKLFKKSGAGPKNGEQYGALFREEEWADDDCFDSVKAADLVIPVEKLPVVISNVKAVDASQLHPPVDDIEEFFYGLADLPDLDEVLGNDNGFMPQQAGLEEAGQSQSTMMDPPPLPGEAIISEPPYSFNTNAAYYDVPPVIDCNQLGCSEWQLPEKSGITNATEKCTLDPHRNEDFLEIDDLAFGAHGSQTMENTSKQANFEESDGFEGIDVFQDAAMFLRDIGSMDQGNIAVSHIHSFSNSLLNQDYYGLQHPHFGDVDQSCSQLWDDEQRLNPYASIQCVQGVQHLPSGAIGDTTNLLNEPSQIQGKDGSGAVTRLSSALWSFVESIPTTPASASESMLVHRAFERMSSFSRIRLNSAATNSRGGNASVVVKTAKSRCFHFLYVGLLVALCGVLIGSLRLWGICGS